MRRATLVYQAGIANVFQEDHAKPRKRLIQSDFRTCEAFARGLAAAGVKVRTRACNQAGDIAAAHFSDNLDDAPFSASFRPVESHAETFWS